ncbi:DUF6774 domain-containing protein [Clostridium omnivorum]|uniref:DUF6774 domain-containing protein n=1 Tax=Clostridium omnivorum TaxID=1604902 RepID=A0ABQ5N2T4_9CLOT|nr:DUF6774 domain-containing protein [Clostridium sp. E14]GLC29518.1 hypothetical protein bsdE14_09280 [Clostridium sp. E14]
MLFFDDIEPEQLTLFASFLAVAISEGRTAGELNILGEFLSTLGDSVSLIAAQKEFLISIQEEKNNTNDKE